MSQQAGTLAKAMEDKMSLVAEFEEKYKEQVGHPLYNDNDNDDDPLNNNNNNNDDDDDDDPLNIEEYKEQVGYHSTMT